MNKILIENKPLCSSVPVNENGNVLEASCTVRIVSGQLSAVFVIFTAL